MRRVLILVAVACIALATLVPAATAQSDDLRSGGTQADARVIVFNGQANDLDAYSAVEPFKHQTVITSRAKDPKGLDLNAQICFFPDGKRFIAGEDTNQPNPIQGWGIFKLGGTKVGKLDATEIGKLQPTYQGSADNAENYGCGILSDGRVVTSDIGNQAEGDGDGQLIIWFPPFTKGFSATPKGASGKVPYCKIDVGMGTAGGIAVDDDDNVYVASARGATTGVLKYAAPFPTSATPDGGCDSTDATGAPMTTTVARTQFIGTDNNLATPNAIAATPDGGWYVTSVFTGVINEYAADGTFVRTILAPPAGETLGAEPFSTGTPLGIGVGPDGTIYFADIGIVVSDDGIGPGDDTGTVRRIRFVDGEPQPPETMASDLAFPDGIGVWAPKK